MHSYCGRMMREFFFLTFFSAFSLSAAGLERCLLEAEPSYVLDEIHKSACLSSEVPFFDSAEEGHDQYLAARKKRKSQAETLGKYGKPRDYESGVTKNESEDIKYILDLLANKPTAKLLFYKSSLDAAGERVNHVHPLRFLEVVFTDEKAKVDILNISKKNWVWKQFINGLGESLNQEKGRQNLTNHQIEDFSSNIGLNSTLIMPSIKQSRWDEMVLLLIKHVPRKTNTQKYNM
ncbi:MAG: hypothetical protein Tsb0021_03470 [Chlamydiales bacterium]